MDNAEVFAHRPLGRTRFGGYNSVAGARVIRQEFGAEVAGSERHLSAGALFAEFFSMLAQSATDSAALQSGINRQHSEISCPSGNADKDRANDPVGSGFCGDKESVAVEHQLSDVLGRRPLTTLAERSLDVERRIDDARYLAGLFGSCDADREHAVIDSGAAPGDSNRRRANKDASLTGTFEGLYP